jgi:hypothetical protein
MKIVTEKINALLICISAELVQRFSVALCCSNLQKVRLGADTKTSALHVR